MSPPTARPPERSTGMRTWAGRPVARVRRGGVWLPAGCRRGNADGDGVAAGVARQLRSLVGGVVLGGEDGGRPGVVAQLDGEHHGGLLARWTGSVALERLRR